MEPVYNDWRLVALTPLPLWVLLLAGLALAAALYFGLRGVSSERRLGRRGFLLGLRALAALLALALLLEPGIELLSTSPIRGRVAVLVDRSLSMTLPSQHRGPSREELAATLLAPGADRAALERKFSVEYFGFAEGVSPMEPAELAALANEDDATGAGGERGLRKDRDPEQRGNSPHDADPTRSDSSDSSANARNDNTRRDDSDFSGSASSSTQGFLREGRGRTEILNALEEVASTTGGRPLAGVVLISDGGDNGAIDEALKAGGERLDEVKGRLKALDAPVFALDTTSGNLKDVAISDLRVDSFAFVRNRVEVEVEVSQHGFPSLDLPVTLLREGQVVSTQRVSVGPNSSSRVTLSFTPDTTGEFAYTVRVPVQEGEAVSANNLRSFVLKVIRDRVRVLHVAGRPSWDERFLRMLLKRDPNVDLISFFILRTPSDLPVASNDELSLIPFPTDEIFHKQLSSFDLVIFHNFNYRPYRMAHYLPGIADYVRNGGAFLMIGGENSFTEGFYGGTAIESVLPVSMGPAPEKLSESPFSPRLTPDGRRHPVTALQQGEARNEAAWAQLPQLEGVNRTSLNSEGHALLEHPTLKDWTGRPAPVVAVREVGRGRSMAITADSAWAWGFMSASQGQPRRSYETFFQQSIRWLVRDPELTQLRVDAEKERYTPQESVALLVNARTRDYGPAAGARLDLELVETQSGTLSLQESGQVAQDGSYRFEVGKLPAGAYRATVSARRGEEDLGQAQDVFVVEESGPEQARPAPRPDVLKLVASETKGEVRSAAGARLSELPIKSPKSVEIGHRKTEPLWDRAWFLLAIALVLGTEWFLRRRWGFF